jgi:hypothetical protein
MSMGICHVVDDLQLLSVELLQVLHLLHEVLVHVVAGWAVQEIRSKVLNQLSRVRDLLVSMGLLVHLVLLRVHVSWGVLLAFLSKNCLGSSISKFLSAEEEVIVLEGVDSALDVITNLFSVDHDVFGCVNSKSPLRREDYGDGL